MAWWYTVGMLVHSSNWLQRSQFPCGDHFFVGPFLTVASKDIGGDNVAN